MAQKTWRDGPPKKILLATDLSGRGDRALDRAAQLTKTWDAELLVIHALEGGGLAGGDYHGIPAWRRPPDTAGLVERQIRGDINEDLPRLRVLVEEGPAARVILETAAKEACDLIVLGAGRQRALGGVGRAVDELFRSSPVSVLVVKRRPHGPYRHVLVGTDFSDEARRGLEAACELFPEALFALMHAYEMPYRSLLLDNPLARDFGEMERATIRDFIDSAGLPAGMRERVVTLIEHGPPEAMLSTYVIERGADLVVIGAYERSRLFHTIIVGKGPRIVETAPCDVLVVRAEQA